MMKAALKKMTKSILRKVITRRQYQAFRGLGVLYFNTKLKPVFAKIPLQKPAVVNLNANDICNSKCAMCNIWEQKQGFEVSPAQLGQILRDPLFSEVKHIGITGGEPTLREDLPQLYEAVIKAIPDIVGLSIITNAIKEKDVIERIEQVIVLCKKYEKGFSMMVSLDGYGGMHDTVRGRPGNFKTAVNVINHFKTMNIPIAIGSTISKVNVWEIDELLFFMKNNDIYGRFRVAEFIKRLYNDNKANVIRNFDEDEVYHLILFFYKLIFTFEKDETFKRTYRSIINILDGGKRLIGCPYQGNGIVLNSRGEIAYCAPKSAIIGNGLAESGQMLYEKNLSERKRIRENECDNCIHDYHAPLTFEEYRSQLVKEFWQKKISLDASQKFALADPFISAKRLVAKGIPQVLIVGWYGTETVGDKAILGGIVDELNAQYQNNFQLVIASIYPFITVRTCKELNLNAHVIESYTSDLIAYAKGSDVVIMGGGPLMDLDDLAIPLRAFQYAKKSGNKTIVYGCGLGPLTKSKYIQTVKQILELADEIKLRDRKSIDMAHSSFGVNKEVSLSGDPAKIYLRRYPIKIQESRILRCYLREWTHEYALHLSVEEFQTKKLQFEHALANYIKQEAIARDIEEIRLEHMHNFVVGNDDRDFSRYFIDQYFKDWNKVAISYDKYLSSVDSIVKTMQNSAHNICMRFHSVVFAHTLQTSFTAVDYTVGGKIHNYLADHDCGAHLIGIEDLITEHS